MPIVKKDKKLSEDKPTLVNFILDESGSMHGFRTQTISGFNEYVNSLKAEAKNKVEMTLTQFQSNNVNIVYSNKNICRVPELTDKTYKPYDMTPLYDAIGNTITKTESKKNIEKYSVLFVIMTDGVENSSQEYTRESIFKMIEEKKKQGWVFTFLGANQDSYAEGMKMGIRHTMDFDQILTAKAMHKAASSTMTFMSRASTGKIYTKNENFFDDKK